MPETLTSTGIVKEVEIPKPKLSDFLKKGASEFFLGTTEKKKEEKKVTGNSLIDNTPLGRKHIIIENVQSNIEAHYYWFINFFQDVGDQYGVGFIPGKMQDPKGGYIDEGEIIKVRDMYSSSEASSYWGNIESRRAAQQDKFAQYMVNIGSMLKSMFPMIRELRLLDERLTYFEDSKKGDKEAETALKTIWTDQVEGGTKTPTSIFALSGQPGYATLPDLFFATTPKSSKDISKELEKISGINLRVKNILGNKLKQYMVWKENVEKEFKQRKNFMLKYLRQHYHVIKLYLNWLRPYLYNIHNLQMKTTTDDYDLVKAFDSSKIELELLGRIDATWVKPSALGKENIGEFQEKYTFQTWHPCLVIKIKNVAIPSMAYQQEGSRGAIHSGTTDIWFESFVAKKEHIIDYKNKQDEDDLKLLELVNSAISSLEDDLVKYLKEADEKVTEKKKEKVVEKEGILEPFKSLVKGFQDLIPGKSKDSEDKPKQSEKDMEREKKIAEELANSKLARTYLIFKLTHGMFVE